MAERKSPKQFVGRVASDRMDKTVVVEVTGQKMHALYGKYVKQSKRFPSHDEQNDCNVGDTVLIEECRPLSRRKRFRVREIIERAV